MSIKNLEIKEKEPRLIGRIKLGTIGKTETGKEYPMETDYFVCSQTALKHEVMGDIRKVYGEKPKELKVHFSTFDCEKITAFVGKNKDRFVFFVTLPEISRTGLWRVELTSKQNIQNVLDFLASMKNLQEKGYDYTFTDTIMKLSPIRLINTETNISKVFHFIGFEIPDVKLIPEK